MIENEEEGGKGSAIKQNRLTSSAQSSTVKNNLTCKEILIATLESKFTECTARWHREKEDLWVDMRSEFYY